MPPFRDPLVGRRLGDIRILGLVEAGGVGAVYRGIDEKLGRKVAVKVLREAQRLDALARQRFLREAQLLSQLHHPHVCQLYGHVEGSADGGDFLILELIEGRSLAAIPPGELGDAAKMRIADQLLDAISAAHRKGVIHRDLKPANVMLADGEVKVLDFGLARTVDEAHAVVRAVTSPEEPPTDSGARPGTAGVSPTPVRAEPDRAPVDGDVATSPIDVHTQQGSILGTLAYMSPEQAHGEPATPASDVYSCGLVLQELFTGETANERNLGHAELLRRAALGQTRSIRGLDPDLTALLERMKSPAPGARPSAGDARDRLAWIRKKPRRRARRAAVAVVLLGLAAVAGTLAFQARRIRHEMTRANLEAATARHVADFLVELFEVSDPGEARGNDVTARELLDVGVRRLRTELAAEPLTRARLLATIGTVYTRLGLYDEATALLEEALELRRRETGPSSAETATGLYDVGEVRLARGDHDAAEAVLEEAQALRRRLLAPGDPEIGRTLGRLGLVLQEKGEHERSQPILEESVAILDAALGPHHLDTLAARSDLALVLRERGRLGESQAILEEVVPGLETAAGPDHPDTARALTNLASVYYERGRYTEAVELFRRDLEISEKVFGPDHRDVAISLNNLAQTYRRSGRHRAAVPLLERSLAIRRALGEDHPLVAAAASNLGGTVAATGDLRRAESLMREAILRWTSAFGPDHHNLGSALRGLAALLRDTGRLEEAQAAAGRALAIRLASLGPTHPYTASARSTLGTILHRRGALAEAAEEYRQAVEVLGANEDLPELPEALDGWAAVELDRGRLDAGRLDTGAELLDRALALVDRTLAARPADLATRERRASLLASAARLADARGDEAAAQKHREDALVELDQVGDDTSLAGVAVRVQILDGLGRGEEARSLRAHLIAAGWRT